jgi:hypothetical protein
VRRLAAIPALLLVAIAVWEIIATRSHAAAVPDDVAWERAAELVRAGHQRGDLIVFAPGWADPVGRLHLGDLLTLDMAGRMDAARYGRIWELAIRGASAPEVTGLVAVEHHEIQGIAVRRYEQPAAVVVSDLRDALATARVEGGTARVELVEVAFTPRRCMVVATPADRPVRITFPNVALGDELVGYVGIADVFTRRENREPVELALTIDGRPGATATAPIDAWVPFRVATRPGRAAVEVTLRWTATGKHRPTRAICVAAEARATLGATTP